MSAIDDREKDLRRALAGLVELARANFPRNTDLTVSLSSSGPANGSVAIPWTLLAKLLKDDPAGRALLSAAGGAE